jgi:SWIM zinc finger
VGTPRRLITPHPQGRLPAAMLRALAAELSDPGRFSRAKAYARDGAVVDIEIEPGEARGVVQGSRYEPYVATIFVAPAGDGEGLLGVIPERRELMPTCSCPDAETFGVCKHALAVLLVLADEVTIEPDLLHRWRSGPGDVAVVPSQPAPDVDVLADLLAARAPLPEAVDIPPRLTMAMAATTDPRDAEVSAAVASAIAALRAH